MSIKLYLPDILRYSIARGKGLFEVCGGTVSECLDDIANLFPGIKQVLFYDAEKKALRSYVKVLLNKERVEKDALATKVKNGDEIHITLKRN